MSNESKNHVLPIVSVLVLVIGNMYQGLTKEELDVISDGLLAVGTLIAGFISTHIILKNKNSNSNDK